MANPGEFPLGLEETQSALSVPPDALRGAPDVSALWMKLAQETYLGRISLRNDAANEALQTAAASDPDSPVAPAFHLWTADNLASGAQWKAALKCYQDTIDCAEKADPFLEGRDFRRVARAGQAEAYLASRDAESAIGTWTELWDSGPKYGEDAERVLRAGLLAESTGNPNLATDCYSRIAAKNDDVAYDPPQLALRAKRRMKSDAYYGTSAAALRSVMADVLNDRDAKSLDRILSKTHFCIGVTGGHFRFEDRELRERVIAELAMCDLPGSDAMVGTGEKRYLFSDGWHGKLLKGRVGLVLMKAPMGWELTGVVLTEVPDELAERWKPRKLQTNQPLPFTLKAPWSFGDNFMAGGLDDFALKSAAVAAAAASTPFGLGGAALALAFSAGNCGYGPRGFYYNDISDTHQDEDAFAIDFTRYRRGVPLDNESGGTAVLAPAPGVVFTANDGVSSGSSSGSNTVEINHADPVTGNAARYRSRYLHLAGPQMLSVSVGMPVITGQRLGRINDTGNSVLDHLHFSIHDMTVPSGNPSRGMSIRPTPMDGTTLGDGNSGACVGSSNRERRPPPLDDAEFVRQTVPTTLKPFETGQASFTFRNSGPTTWLPGFRLVSLATGWTIEERAIGQTVAPGDEVTVQLGLVALTPGNFDVQWRMARQFSGSFGQPSRRVTVTVERDDVQDQCAELDQALQAAEFDLQTWQSLLQTAPPGQKPAIIDQIQQIQGQITAILAQKQSAGCP